MGVMEYSFVFVLDDIRIVDYGPQVAFRHLVLTEIFRFSRLPKAMTLIHSPTRCQGIC